jgi:hypothetical protein
MNTISPIEIFRARCEARARLFGSFAMDLQTAVDELQESAERDGLVQALGQDAVQEMMSNAFRQWRGEC